MSDEQTPDVTAEDEANDAQAPDHGEAPSAGARPVEAQEPPGETAVTASRGRRAKGRSTASAVPAPVVDAADQTDLGPSGDVASDDDAGGADGGGSEVVREDSMSATDFEALTGELKDPELFDPAEVANAPRAPHPLKPVVEALIFASPEPLTLKAMGRLLDDQPKDDIEAALAEVRESYLRSDGLQLVEVAGGFQIVTRPELYEWVRRLFKERTTSKLSVQALETLAVIAYKQPVTSGEIAEIRGVSATTGVLNTLLDRKLVKIVGRKQVVGRPFMYGTTREFLDKFGLKDLTDLPKVEDMSEALGFDLPTPVDEGDGASLPFDDTVPVEPLLFEAAELGDTGAAAVSASARPLVSLPDVELVEDDDVPADPEALPATDVPDEEH
jgi:segregation and condensation protein B